MYLPIPNWSIRFSSVLNKKKLGFSSSNRCFFSSASRPYNSIRQTSPYVHKSTQRTQKRRYKKSVLPPSFKNNKIIPNPEPLLNHKLHLDNKKHQPNQIVVNLAGISCIFRTIEHNKKRLTIECNQITFQKSMELGTQYTN